MGALSCNMNHLALQLRNIATQLARIADAIDNSAATIPIGASQYCRAQECVIDASGNQHKLTAAQTQVLGMLCDHRGVVVPRDALELMLYGGELRASRTLDTIISQLRGRLGRDTIVTHPMSGYRLIEQPQ